MGILDPKPQTRADVLALIAANGGGGVPAVIDGGNATSTYTSTTNIDGGSATS
jgi:hypothetical protein